MRNIIIVLLITGAVCATEAKTENVLHEYVVHSPRKKKNYRNHLMKSYFGEKAGCRKTVCYR